MVRPLADRHYSRQSPGTPNFVPPGRHFVLYAETASGSAYWVTTHQYPKYIKHFWPYAWNCSAFRNEGAGLSSDLIRQAVSASRHMLGPAPPQGMITFVDPSAIKKTNRPGWCFLKAGFKDIGKTDKGLVVLQMLPDLMPVPLPPRPSLDDEWSLHRRGV